MIPYFIWYALFLFGTSYAALFNGLMISDMRILVPHVHRVLTLTQCEWILYESCHNSL